MFEYFEYVIPLFCNYFPLERYCPSLNKLESPTPNDVL